MDIKQDICQVFLIQKVFWLPTQKHLLLFISSVFCFCIFFFSFFPVCLEMQLKVQIQFASCKLCAVLQLTVNAQSFLQYSQIVRDSIILQCSVYIAVTCLQDMFNLIFLKYNNSLCAVFSWPVSGQVLFYLTSFHTVRARQPFS